MNCKYTAMRFDYIMCVLKPAGKGVYNEQKRSLQRK